MKIGIPRAFSAALVGEFLASGGGHGHYIAGACSTADTVGVYTGIVAVAGIVLTADFFLGRLQTRLLHWRQTDSLHS